MASRLIRSYRRAYVGAYDLLGVEHDPLATYGRGYDLPARNLKRSTRVSIPVTTPSSSRHASRVVLALENVATTCEKGS